MGKRVTFRIEARPSSGRFVPRMERMVSENVSELQSSPPPSSCSKDREDGSGSDAVGGGVDNGGDDDGLVIVLVFADDYYLLCRHHQNFDVSFHRSHLCYHRSTPSNSTSTSPSSRLTTPVGGFVGASVRGMENSQPTFQILLVLLGLDKDQEAAADEYHVLDWSTSGIGPAPWPPHLTVAPSPTRMAPPRPDAAARATPPCS